MKEKDNLNKTELESTNNKREKSRKKQIHTNSDAPSSKYKYLIKNREIRRHSQGRKIVIALTVFLAITLILGGAVYGILLFIEYNNFKVMIDKSGLDILSLSHSQDFSNPSEVISLGGPRYMDNITLMDIYYLIPEFEKTEGTYGDESTKHIKYMAATFFLKNVSEKDKEYREAMRLTEVTKGIDEAVRIMVIRDGERVVYARPKKDGTPEEVVPGQSYAENGDFTADPEKVWMTEPFHGEDYVFYNSGIPLGTGEMTKYTLLVWLEGWDEDCIDPILGGKLKLEIEFSNIT